MPTLRAATSVGGIVDSQASAARGDVTQLGNHSVNHTASRLEVHTPFRQTVR